MIRRRSVDIGMDGSLFVLVKRELKTDAAVIVVDDTGCCS